MSEAKYKVGQEVVDPYGDRHVVTDFRYVVKRVYAKPIAGIPHGIGCLNTYEESDLSPYVRPLAVGDRVRWHNDIIGDPPLELLAIDGPVAWCKRIRPLGGYSTLNVRDLERIPTEAGK